MSTRQLINKEKNYLLWFIGWTYLMGFIPLFFKIENPTIQDVLFKALAGPTPSIVGAIFVFITYSKEKRKDYFKRCFSLKQRGWKIPLITMLGYAFVCALSIQPSLVQYLNLLV